MVHRKQNKSLFLKDLNTNIIIFNGIEESSMLKCYIVYGKSKRKHEERILDNYRLIQES